MILILIVVVLAVLLLAFSSSGVFLLVGSLLFGSTVPSLDGLPQLKQWFGNAEELVASEHYFDAERGGEVLFTIDLGQRSGTVQLRSESGPVAEMRDDGRDGDAVPGDGVYSCVVHVESGGRSSMDYYATYGWKQSWDETLYFFSRPTRESAETARLTAEKLGAELGGLERQYDDEARLLNEAERYVAELERSGEIATYTVDPEGIYIKLASGLAYYYSPERSAVTAGSGAGLTLLTFQPERDRMVREGLESGLNELDEIAESLGVAARYADGAADLAAIRAFGPDQAILWHGHGFEVSGLGPCLVTGERFDWETWLEDPDYFADCLVDRALCRWDGQLCVTPRYIETRCGDLTGSLVYLAACSSGADASLAQAFLSHGAAAVVANTGTIREDYNLTMLNATLRCLTELDPETGDYRTLRSALDAAKAEYGASDADGRYGGAGAAPEVFGGPAAEAYQLRNSSSVLSGRVCRAAEHDTPVAGAEILAYRGGHLAASTRSDDAGYYSLRLPEGGVEVDISAEGFVPFRAFASIEEESTTYMETFLLVDGSDSAETGRAGGRIIHSLTGAGVEGVTLTARAGWNNQGEGEAVTTAVTDADGAYSLELPLGNYTLLAEKEGFIASWINIVVQRELTLDQNGSMTPVLSDESFRIVLTWAENPHDLDSHVTGTMSDGRSFHVYYRQMTQREGDRVLCALDIDDTSSYGPETITLTPTGGGPFYYYVFRYSGSGTVASSEALVRVYQGSRLIASYPVPTGQGGGDYWNVFALSDGQIVTKNTIGDSPDLSYCG